MAILLNVGKNVIVDFNNKLLSLFFIQIVESYVLLGI
jgi:hypothetical protein